MLELRLLAVAEGAELQAAGTDARVVQRAQGVYYVVGQSPTRISSLLGRCIIPLCR